MGKVDQIGFTTLIILIAASICTLAIGCVCILILTSGISKEMRLRAELISQLDARRRAEASSNCKSQFLANMSHELRTPMAAVIGLLDILMCDDYLTTEQFATITQIRKCSTALLHLLNNILDLSKVESGKLLLEEAEFDIGKELEGIVDMFSAQCINHNVEIVLELSDDMPILVHGDSARVIQIFTNLISNSIKFTSSGHIILRGWCENFDTSGMTKLSTSQNKPHCLFKRKSKPRETIMNNDKKSNRKIILWFEVDDTGCGIDPSKWESVFESFEQADPSTTRTHGGTGLGLCIVRNLVTKMGGEIKVVKKDGSGTLMQLYLVLGMPLEGTGLQFHLDFGDHNFMVLLALKGSMGRLMMSQWLRQNGVYASLASEWNELAQMLQETFQGKQSDNKDFVECSTHKAARLFPRDITRKMETPNIVVVDADILDLSSNIWRQQLYFLDNYHAKAKFAWILNHDTPSEIKFELQRKGHLLIVNKPLYKTKMIQILKTVIQEKKRGMRGIKTPIHDVHEFLDTDPIQFNVISDNSDVSDSESWELRNGSFPDEERNKKVYPHKTANSRKEIPHSVHPDIVLQDSDSSPQAGNFPSSSKNSVTLENYRNDCRNNHCNPTEIISFMNQGNVLVDSNQECFQDELKVSSTMYEIKQMKSKPMERETASTELPARQMNMQISGGSLSNIPCGRLEFNARQAIINYPKAKDPVTRVKAISEQNSLSGLRILLAEDTPVLQRVATIMLEKMGATVTAVGDGMQVVDALKCMLGAGECLTLPSEQKNGMLECQTQGNHTFDLILMDCQMPKLDGYDATKAIRRFEAGTGSHIPIVALTAHAMSSDETKCLEVGMDAYLTKPIDCELMVSTILSFTDKRVS
ncbi:Histidine kinase 1 [Acorus calamus]|uniref:Histidine kinase 1 n=1 Tax=Acorus calamus TaxID=4465 RepID=A0AAV9FBN9_ACOCL|nr:Histidine kinase 1 [Acorus calamus]